MSTASLIPIVAEPASATSATTLYVDNTSPTCSDSGTGMSAAPFCTIQAAANVVAPGQTVLIGGINNGYNEDVKVKSSGTPSAPITFAAAGTYFTDAEPDHAFTVTGVSNIVIKGLYGDSTSDTVLVSGSSNITIENSTLRQDSSSPAATTAGVHVTGASSAVTIERDHLSRFGMTGEGIRVDGGSTGTVIATNDLDIYGNLAIEVVGASGTEIAGNTIGSYLPADPCGFGISVTSSSTSTSIENNVISGISSTFSTPCAAGHALDLVVSGDSAGTTTAQYNVLSTDSGGTVPYKWAGTTYATASAFQTATGKGAQDVVQDSVNMSAHAMPTSSPVIDSADANAPGETTTDIYGNPRVDNASNPNTGTGVGYYDRGAFEYEEYTSGSLDIQQASPQYIGAGLSLTGIAWGTSVKQTIDWGDGTPKETLPVTTDGIDLSYATGDNHSYALPGTYTVTMTLTDDGGTKTWTKAVTTTGSTYTPVAPTRVLDTRHGTGTGGSTTPVPPNGDVAFDVTSGVTGAPAPSSITAVVLNVTVTAPTAGGYITAYPDGTAVPHSSNLNFSAGETVPNLVTVKVGADGKVALHNGAGGTSHLVADVEGYYTATATGSGFAPVSPTRLLDTRKGTGTGGSTNPVPAGGTISLKIDGNGPVPASGVTAVALNVTVTKPTGGGFVTVYPGQTTLPKASNLNFSAGETVPNLVIVPVGADGTVNLTNGSNGTVALIADVSGYYTSTGGRAFVPVAPIRILDTRTGQGTGTAPHPLPANRDQPIFLDQSGNPDLSTGTALVLNVTVTNPTAGGYITAFPYGTPLPTVSNLNFSAGETVPNLVITGRSNSNDPALHNGSAGTVNLVADAFGYFS